MDSELHTTQLRFLVDRMHQGDQSAVDELMRRASRRLESLARSMLRRFPRVSQHEQTADVVQEAVLTMLSALRQLSFTSTREFYGLAAEHIRRRLLDLARRYDNPARSPALLADGQPGQLPSVPNDDELDRWALLHQAAETLTAECREVFSLRFYHGWTVEQIAVLLQTSDRTVKRYWSRAVLALSERVGQRGLPGEVGEPVA